MSNFLTRAFSNYVSFLPPPPTAVVVIFFKSGPALVKQAQKTISMTLLFNTSGNEGFVGNLYNTMFIHFNILLTVHLFAETTRATTSWTTC